MRPTGKRRGPTEEVRHFSLLCCFVLTEDILVGFCPIDLALERMCIRDDPGPGRPQFQFQAPCSESESCEHPRASESVLALPAVQVRLSDPESPNNLVSNSNQIRRNYLF